MMPFAQKAGYTSFVLFFAKYIHRFAFLFLVQILKTLENTFMKNKILTCVVLTTLVAAACTRNAITGRNQLALVSEEQVESMMAGNLCRCGTYHRIKQAINEVINP